MQEHEARSAWSMDMNPSPASLVACPNCDLLHNSASAAVGERLRCARCGTLLASSRPNAIDRTLAAAMTNVILIVSALFFPFIQLDGAGTRQSATLIDAVSAFGGGLTTPLVLVVAAFIIIIPFLRASALIYTLWPLRFGRRPYHGATRAFRFANSLKPWSMAEIFIIGVAVALVKVAGLAEVSLGPAFWMLTALVVVLLLENHNFCRWTIWRILGTHTQA